MRVYKQDTNQIILSDVRWCESFLCKLRGLTFRQKLRPGEGLLLVEGRESQVSTAIHMLAVFTPLGVAWLDSERRVVHLALAKPWRLSYASPQAAKYVLEGPPSMLESLQVGDQLAFEHEE